MKTIIILSLIFANTYLLFANESPDSLKSFYTGELVIMPLDKNISVVSDISEIKINSIESSRFLTVDNSLKFAQSIYFQKNSRNEAFIGIRGYDQRQIGIFFDGVPISSQYDGTLDLSIFSLNNLSKITVSKNFSSMYYGSNAIAGTINLITDDIFKENSINAQLQAGHLNQNYSAEIAQSLGKLNMSLDINYQNNSNFNYPDNGGEIFSSNMMQNSSNKILNSFAKVAYSLSDMSIFSLSYLMGRSDKDIPVNLLSDRKRYWKMPEINRDLINFTHFNKISDNILIRGNLYYEETYNLLRSYDDDTFTGQTLRSAFNSTYDDYQFGGNLITEINTFSDELTKFSINYQRSNHQSQSNTGEQWKEYESSLMTIAAEQNLSYNSLNALFGGSYDVMMPYFANGEELRPNSQSFNYHFGLSYNFENGRIFGSYSVKSRFPTQKEFYSELSGVALQNPDLKSERGQNSELGAIFNLSNSIKISSSIYYNNINDLIDVSFLGNNQRQFINIGKAVFAGVELSSQYDADKFDISLAYSYLYSENKSENSDDTRLLNRPEHSITGSINYDITKTLIFNTSLVYYTGHFTANQNTGDIISLDDYTIINLSLTKTFAKFQVFLNADNLLSNYNEFEWGLPQPGFNYQFGVRVNI